MANIQQFVESVSGPEEADHAAVTATPGNRTTSLSPDSNATAGAAPAKSEAVSQQLPPDPEAITNIVKGDFLVTIAVGIVTLLAIFGLIMAFT